MNIKKFLAGSVAGALMFGAIVFQAFAAPPSTISATPWIYDPGSACPGIVSVWDSSTGNPSPALHLTKPCLTATNAASGATLNGVTGWTLTELSFDYRNDGHCGAGAPRFNVDASDGFHFLGGCSNGTQTDLGNGWTHVTIDPTNPAQAFPVIAAGATINSIDVVFDEGTDTEGGTPGSTFIDNISVNGNVIGNPSKMTNTCKNGGWMDLTSPTFRSQGDCVSWFMANPNAVGNRKDNPL